MNTIFMIMLAVILLENFIFSTILGKKTFARGNPSSVIWAGITIIAALSAAIGAAWLVYNFIWANMVMQAIVFLLIVAAFTWLARLSAITKHIPFALRQNFDLFGLIMMINCSILSVVLIAINSYEPDLLQNIIHIAFSTGGFMVAVMILMGMREKLKFAEPLSLIKGIPIAIITAGLVAMVFFAIS